MGPVNAVADRPHVAKVDDTRGGTLGELLLVVASIGVLAVLAAPALVSYWRTSSLQAGARELASTIKSRSAARDLKKHHGVRRGRRHERSATNRRL